MVMMMIPSRSRNQTQPSLLSSLQKRPIEEDYAEEGGEVLPLSTTTSSSSSPSTTTSFLMQPQSAPASSRVMPKRSSSTAAIPIAAQLRRSSSDACLMNEEEMVAEADYKDYMIYSRIVNGISRQMDSRDSSSWKHQNQQCLENIVRARHDMEKVEDPHHQYYYYCTTSHQQQQQHHQRLVHYVSGALEVSEPPLNHHYHFDEPSEEAIFDLEL
jgi:hypothetical protein